MWVFVFKWQFASSDGNGAPRAQSTAFDWDGDPRSQSTAPRAQSTAFDGMEHLDRNQAFDGDGAP